jgi:CheY-like chemotaxis protein
MIDLPVASAPLKILIADDEQLFADTTAELLRRAGHKTRVVSDADAALRALAAEAYDVVVADIQMPGNAELRLLRVLREMYPDTAVVLVTGYPSLDTAIRAMDFSVRGYLVKPLTIEQLQERLDHVEPRCLRNDTDHMLRELGARNAPTDAPRRRGDRPEFEELMIRVTDLLERITILWCSGRQNQPARPPFAQPQFALRSALLEARDLIDQIDALGIDVSDKGFPLRQAIDQYLEDDDSTDE